MGGLLQIIPGADVHSTGGDVHDLLCLAQTIALLVVGVKGDSEE